MAPVPVRKYAQAAAIVRAQIADGTLKPGQRAPSGGSLARLTGFCTLTCRKALQSLVAEGVLSPGPSPNARPRVTVPGGTRPAGAGPELSRALAGLRRANGLTQPALAALTGYSVTTIGHAETGRLWQSREFWEKADAVLTAVSELTRRYDAYRAEGTGPARDNPQPCIQAPAADAGPPALIRLTLHWSDGSATTACPPGSPGLQETGNP